MNKKKACRILGIYPDISVNELKKRYRNLMNLTHPDSVEKHDYPYEVYEINAAYDYMLKNLESEVRLEKHSQEHAVKWNAPINNNAYCKRDIYQYYEDYEGNQLGIVAIDQGKYIWIIDEEFPLFLKSLYNAAKSIIADDDAKKGISRTNDMKLMGDIAYLLAGQFFSSETALSLMKNEDGIYYTKAGLELDAFAEIPKVGDMIVPQGIKEHKLYVADGQGNRLGYLSLADDRLLFGIVPLFERKAVKLKLQIGNVDMRKKEISVHLWLKPVPEESVYSIDNISIRIDRLLEVKKNI